MVQKRKINVRVEQIMAKTFRSECGKMRSRRLQPAERSTCFTLLRSYYSAKNKKVYNFFYYSGSKTCDAA